MSTVSCRILSSPILSSYELARATDHLVSTRDGLLQTVEGLSDSQWHFKPAPERWSVAETLEHVVLIEERVHAIVGRMQDAPPAEPDRVNSQADEIILAQVPDRSTKLKAPPQVSPSLRWSPAETAARFQECRAVTLQLLVEGLYLRGHVLPHPVFGAWDGYQWILAGALHSARHTAQILELKACPLFPRPEASPVSIL